MSAADEFTSGGRRYRFASWSDGGARLHDVTVPATALTLTATYTDVGPAGLVAAYSFEEGSGATTADVSGKGNAGTLSGASWSTAGRYGKALSFDGGDDWVTVADSASLDLTSAMTLEAWVKPTSAAPWTTVLFKELNGNWHSYALYATAATNVPEAVAHTTEVPGTTALPQSAWTHLAATFDGVAVKLYVNGTLVRTVARTAAMPAGTGPLRIGGNSIWGEYFKGTIDEVRIYSRALTAAQIQTDRIAGI